MNAHDVLLAALRWYAHDGSHTSIDALRMDDGQRAKAALAEYDRLRAAASSRATRWPDCGESWNLVTACGNTGHPYRANIAAAPSAHASPVAEDEGAELIAALREFKTRDWHGVNDDGLADRVIAYIASHAPQPASGDPKEKKS